MAGVRRFGLERLAVATAAVAVTVLPLVAFQVWAPDMGSLVRHPLTTRLTPAEADTVRTALWFDFAYLAAYAAVLYTACRRITANLVRYRWVGKWMARLAVAGALADVTENVFALRLIDDPSRRRLDRPVAGIRQQGEVGPAHRAGPVHPRRPRRLGHAHHRS